MVEMPEAPSTRRSIRLAITKLEEERDRIDSELADIKRELRAESGKKPVKRKKQRFPAKERKAGSERMKKYWADRKKKKKK